MYFIKTHCPENLKFLKTGHKHPEHRFWMPGGGYDRNIIILDTLKKAMDYIHNNPVRAELVTNPADWRWSSYGFWNEGVSGPVPVDKQGVGW